MSSKPQISQTNTALGGSMYGNVVARISLSLVLAALIRCGASCMSTVSRFSSLLLLPCESDGWHWGDTRQTNASSAQTFVREEIVSRQFTERHLAELENMYLKMILKGKINVAKSLEKC